MVEPIGHNASGRKRLRRIAFYIFASFLGIVIIFPLFWMLSMSLRPEKEVYQYPPRLMPSKLEWSNYVKAWSDPRLQVGICTRNSLIYGVTRAFLQLLLASMAAYILARYEFRGREVIFGAILATVMIPDQVKMVPLFLMLKKVPLAGGNDLYGVGGKGWLDSFPGLILPSVVTGYSIFFLRQFFLTLPKDLEDAARVDGSSEIGIYYRIILPMSTPALVALGLFAFQTAWGDFTWPLIITSSERIKTLQLGLAMFNTLDGVEWTLLMAGAVVSTVPMMVLFTLLQKHLATGISFGVGK